MPFNVKDWVIPGVIAGAVTYGLQQVFTRLSPLTVTFATVDVHSKLTGGLGTTVGNKIFGLVGGGINAPSLVTLLFSAVIIVIVGAFLASKAYPGFVSKKPAIQWAVILFYGSVVTTSALAVASGNFNPAVLLSMGTVVLAIYSVIVGFTLSFIFDNVLKRQQPQMPA